MKRVVVMIVWILMCGMVWSQSSQEADRLFKEGKYAEAGELYGRLRKKSPSNALYQYRYGRCKYEEGEPEEALVAFRAAGNRYVLTSYYMGECYMELWRFEEAVSAYEAYIDARRNTAEGRTIDEAVDRRLVHVRREMKKAEVYGRYMKRVAEVCIVDSAEVAKGEEVGYIGARLSSEAGSLRVDGEGGVVYTSQRGDRAIMSLVDRGTPKIGRFFGEAPDSSWSIDKKMVLAQRERLVGGWTEAVVLPEVVNSGERQGYPYYLSDGVTLYFAQEDSSGLGGWDILVSRFNTALNTWTKPENIGMPFNSGGNDYMYAEDAQAGVGYFATDRFSDSAHVRVYTFVLPERRRYVKDAEGEELNQYARLQAYCKGERRMGEGRMDDESNGDNHIAKVQNDDEESEIEKAERQLEWLREQYAEGDEGLREQLRPAILVLEQAIDSLYKE